VQTGKEQQVDSEGQPVDQPEFSQWVCHNGFEVQG
jgi:hypothetical protein